MIFVTVGTTYFDELVREVDRLAGQGAFDEPVHVQLGRGQYIPEHCEWFRYAPSLDEQYRRARLVICHGGVGTVFRLLELGTPFIAMANRSLQDDHQTDLLRALERRQWCTCCYEIHQLAGALSHAELAPSYEPDGDLGRQVWQHMLSSRAAGKPGEKA
jgi:beta-1,4-N-acetylglucosaminyltransferase